MQQNWHAAAINNFYAVAAQPEQEAAGTWPVSWMMAVRIGIIQCVWGAGRADAEVEKQQPPGQCLG